MSNKYSKKSELVVLLKTKEVVEDRLATLCANIITKQ